MMEIEDWHPRFPNTSSSPTLPPEGPLMRVEIQHTWHRNQPL